MMRRLLIWPIRLWQWGPSRVLPPTCRFAPSCSAYAIEAIEKHGPVRGGWLAVRRIGRCHPWGGSGYDPVP
jgi:putative membrane protein insertion efficiency factor